MLVSKTTIKPILEITDQIRSNKNSAGAIPFNELSEVDTFDRFSLKGRDRFEQKMASIATVAVNT